MKKSSTYIVFRHRETGEFLKSYNDRGTLAFEADFCCFADALRMPVKQYEKNKKTYKQLAKLFECEIIKVEANYDLTYPNGGKVEKVQLAKPNSADMPGVFKILDAILGG